MISRMIPTERELTSVRWEERPWASLLHLLGWIPIWGFLVAAVFWLFFRQRSRQIVFQVQQVVQFQIMILLPLVVWCVATILVRVLAGILPDTGATIQVGLNFIASLLLTAAAAMGIWAAIQIYIGRCYLYPIFGQRVLQASIRKLTEV